MSKLIAISALSFLPGLLTSECFGQSNSTTTSNSNFSGDRQEYIQSTTQLSNGMIVSSTSTPGQPTQTSIGFGSTLQRPTNQPSQVYLPASNQQNNLAGTLNQQPVLAQQRLAQANPNQDVFQAPIGQPQPTLQPMTNQQPIFQQPIQTPSAFGQSILPANQIPTLGAPGNYVTPPLRQNANCNCGNQLAVQVPGLGVTHSSLDYTNGNLTGTAGPRPVIPIRNLPPGTYVGQGALGQPTAYVDGQPIRNLFRYLIFP